MDQKIVQQVTSNALEAQKIFCSFLGKRKNPTAFLKCFHLRPTSAGITIVSTLPFAAMRGITVKCSELAVKLDILSKNFTKLVGVDEEQARDLLYGFGFRECTDKSSKDTLEEDVQAAFIRGMVDNQAEYDGVQFIASELNLEQKNRLDIVGIKGNCLYVFELKKGRTTCVFAQVSRYLDHLSQYRNEFCTLLQSYPNPLSPIEQIGEVKGIAVMRYAENSPATTWEPLVEQHKVDVWFYKQAISFQKFTK